MNVVYLVPAQSALDVEWTLLGKGGNIPGYPDDMRLLGKFKKKLVMLVIVFTFRLA